MNVLFRLLSLGALTFLFAPAKTSAQVSFSHSLGASYYAGGGVACPAIMYSPRANVLNLSDESTVSVGTHLGLGFSFNSQSGGAFALDFPLVAELNLGHAASEDSEADFGAFFGAGYGISKIGYDDGFGGGYNNAAGFVINGGLRAYVNSRSMGIRISYLKNRKEDAGNVLGLGFFYNFGM